MAKRLNPAGLIEQKNYLFANHAQLEGKVYPKFIETTKIHKIPVACSEETVKSGGMLLGSNAKMLIITASEVVPFAALGTVVYGNFLSVSLYFFVEDNFLNKIVAGRTGIQSLAVSGKDMISVRSTYAFWNTVNACLEQSLADLGFEEFKGGFLGIE